MKRFITYLSAHKTGGVYLLGVLLLLLSALLGLLVGSTHLSFSEIFASLSGAADTPSARIVRYVRLPRVGASLLCGAALAVAGAVIQRVLANPLASPSIIGVNAGAGLAVTVCAACGVVGGFRVSLFAFLGAFLCVLLVLLGAKRFGASRSTVVLMGVAINSLLGAISDAVVTFSPELAIQKNAFRVGDFSSVNLKTLPFVGIGVVVGIVLLLTLSCEMDVLTLGEENAQGLGAHTDRLRVLLLLLAALLAGAAVSIAGLLSFVGLLVPHIVRRIAPGEAGHTVALCALFGGAFVTLCDTLARTLFAPYEIPVGIFMAFLGAPFFLFLLIYRKGGHRRA